MTWTMIPVPTDQPPLLAPLDRVADAPTLTRLWLFDLIHGPEPMTPADELREVERARLRTAFRKVDFDRPGAQKWESVNA